MSNETPDNRGVDSSAEGKSSSFPFLPKGREASSVSEKKDEPGARDPFNSGAAPPPPPPPYQSPTEDSVVPPPPSVSPGADVPPPPGGYNSDTGSQVIDYGETADLDTEASKKALKYGLIGIGALLALIIVGGLIFEWVRLSNMEKKTGLMTYALYGQTRNKMPITGLAVYEYIESHGSIPEGDEIAKIGYDPAYMRDGWKTPFRINENLIISAGQDKEFDTEDDFWMDYYSMEFDGFFPDIDDLLENDALPDEVRKMLLEMKKEQESQDAMTDYEASGY